jgi:dGTPase
MVVRDLALRLLEEPDLLPPKWREGDRPWTQTWQARRVADYVASMTDRFALAEHRRLFDALSDLR